MGGPKLAAAAGGAGWRRHVPGAGVQPRTRCALLPVPAQVAALACWSASPARGCTPAFRCPLTRGFLNLMHAASHPCNCVQRTRPRTFCSAATMPACRWRPPAPPHCAAPTARSRCCGRLATCPWAAWLLWWRRGCPPSGCALRRLAAAHGRSLATGAPLSCCSAAAVVPFKLH